MSDLNVHPSDYNYSFYQAYHEKSAIEGEPILKLQFYILSSSPMICKITWAVAFSNISPNFASLLIRSGS